jgi:prepilin-type N-terminal cleavage/methylation domain-containing protein
MKLTTQLLRKQKGFTLVEIAIVLVIIGLLLGGVLKGQEMIENGRIKSVVNDMSGISAAYNSYLDRYHAIPGDETAAVMTNRGWKGAVGSTGTSTGNGQLDVPPLTTFTNQTGADEQAPFWRALRGSGLASGDPAAPIGAASLPRAGTGGLIGVTSNVYGMSGPAVCISGLTAKQAAGIDAAVDGPVATTGFANTIGSVRADVNATNPLPPTTGVPPNNAYNENTAGTWTVCRKI